MPVSSAGRAAITQREGRRLSAYRDSGGVWTIGVGHAATGLPPHPHAGMTITEGECDALLAADLAPVDAAIEALGVTLTQNQFDACASLAFNIGVHAFATSSVARFLKAGKIAAAADAFLLWDKPAELKARREAEKKQFLSPDHHPLPVAVAAPAKPTPAPAAAAPASHLAAESTSMNPISTLTALASLAHAGFTVAESLGSAAPQLAKGANSIVTSGKTVVADLGKVVSDLKAGKYADEPADLQRAWTDIGTAISAVEAEVEPIASLVASSTALPSAGGIAALLAKI